MKYSEFKNWVTRGTNYYVRHHDGKVYIILCTWPLNPGENEQPLKKKLLSISENKVGILDSYEGLLLLTKKERLALQKLAYRYSRTPLDKRRNVHYGFQLDNGCYVYESEETFDGSTSHITIDATEKRHLAFSNRKGVEHLNSFMKGKIVSDDDD